MERVKQFQTDSQQGPNKNTKKQINILRKFLFKNQDYRFTEGDKLKLFTSIQNYYNMLKDNQELSQELILPLVEDALKMPFNVISSKQKQKLMKYYQSLSGENPSQNSQAKDSLGKPAEKKYYDDEYEDEYNYDEEGDYQD